MKPTIKLMVVVVAVCVALVATVFTAFATRGAPSVIETWPSQPSGLIGHSQSAGCDAMQASDVAWVTLTSNHHIDKQVSSYASGTSRITPVFQYNCAPANTIVVSVFSLNGQTIFTDKEALPARTTASLYGYALETVDGTPLSDGQWDVQYFNDKTPLTTGSVTVGQASGDTSQSATVTVGGIVQDQNSQTPIEGAVILILNPGVKLQDFIQNGKQDSDVYTAGKSDSQGAFTLQKKLERHRVYAMIVAVEGYKSLGSDTFQVKDEADPVSITISMTK